MKTYCPALALLTLVATLGAAPAPEGPVAAVTTATLPPGQLGKSLRNEVNAAMDRGLDFLSTAQKDNGSWSNGDFPALTGLAMQAFVAAGSHPRRKKAVQQAAKYILSCRRDDGGIYRHIEGRKGGGLSNYNTAICMTALHASGDPAYAPVVRKARDFMAGAQHLGDDMYKGGFGYDRNTGRAYADLLNTYYSVVAMRETQGVEDLRPAGEKRADIDWERMQKFIDKLQNPAEAGKDQEGGFHYHLTDAKAGLTTNKAGVVFLRSYGSMTYAGLLALIYAEVPRDDPRVRSAFQWSARHWSLEENPGMGAQGLFFFYNVLTKALNSYGADLIPIEGGGTVNWRQALATRLVGMQKIDPKTGHGFWRNDHGRFWEADPVLCTSYAILALAML